MQDFATILEYDASHYKNESHITLSSESIIDKQMIGNTFSTFHAAKHWDGPTILDYELHQIFFVHVYFALGKKAEWAFA